MEKERRMLEHGNTVDQPPARVVLLGGSGFIGKCLCDAVAARDIASLSLSTAELNLTADTAHEALAAQLRADDVVIFLAAITPNRGRGIDAFVDNMAMAATVARALEASPPAHVICLSSDAVYPMTQGLVREDSSVATDDLYGAMHRAREVLLQSACTAPVAIVRPSLIYGAADTHNSYGPNRLRRMARDAGRITLFGGGEEQRDHILVDDVVALLLRIILRRSSGLLNIATGTSVSYAALAEMIAAQFDSPPAIETTPRQNPISHRHFDVTALIKAFPDFTFTPLEAGIAQAHRDMMERGID
jgi:nucleoside-diphosphate-sugar epimerase